MSLVLPTFTLTLEAALAAPPEDDTRTPATFRVLSRVIRSTDWLEKSGVGAFVGNIVGDFVGSLVGAGVGAMLGGLEGATVGDSDKQSHVLPLHSHVKSPTLQSELR
jgi:hypothetical protein